MKATDVGRLLRLSLAPSAAADALAGLVWAHHGRFPTEARWSWLVVASLGVYHGALALNDWNDREHDARTRPGRPVPAGAIAPRAALATACVALAVGIAAAWYVGPRAGAWMTGVAVLAVAYDLVGRGPWIGPVLLGACRAGNLSCATFAVVGFARGSLEAFLPAVLYGLYVFLVSRLGRMEDGEDAQPLGARPGQLLRGIAVVPALLAVLLAWPVVAGGAHARLDGDPARLAGLGLGLLLVAFTVRGLLRLDAVDTPWTRARVEGAVGACLRRLLVLTALVALASATSEHLDAWIVAAVILAGYPLAHALRRAFPPS